MQQNIQDLEKQTLIEKIKKLESELNKVKSCKRYGLVWEDKEEEFDKESIGKLPILEEIYSKNIHQNKSKNNILIEGDNYHTLSVLNYTHKGKIDVIYIDPPYNTGNKDFTYNDRIIDKEDKFRHSKWLSFMNKRLRLAKELLSESGTIFISIDNNEIAQLKLLCDDIYGEENLIGIIKWRRTENQSNIAKHISTITEYVLCYGKTKDHVEFNKLSLSEKALKEYRYKDSKGSFRRNILLDKKKGRHKYEIKTPGGNILNGPWMKTEEDFNKLLKNDLIYWSERGDFTPYLKNYLDKTKGVVANDFWDTDKGSNQQSSLELERILINNKIFSFPKHTKLIRNILKISSDKNSTVLDFFAGSGTTGHAVLDLNKEDGGNRKFILATNNENNICEEVTYQRLKKVMIGYTNTKGEKVEGLGGNLTYLKTKFLDKTNVNDDLRIKMVQNCSELLCLKENIWNEIKQENPSIKLYKRNDKYLAILFDMFYFEEFKKMINGLDNPVSVYAFSHYKLGLNDFDGIDNKIYIEEIPDPILEVYENIFGL